MENARVVDQDVDGSGAFGQVGDLCGVGQVGGLEAGLGAEGFDALEGVGGPLFIAAVDDDVGAAGGQGQGGGPADAGGGAGDQGSLLGEVVVHGRTRSLWVLEGDERWVTGCAGRSGRCRGLSRCGCREWWRSGAARRG